MKIQVIVLLVFSSIIFCSNAIASDSFEERTKAAERYLSVMPMKNLLNDGTKEMAKQIPEEKREKFVNLMNKLLDAEKLEDITKRAMIKIFTAEELNALADFYGSKVGKSAMKKFGVYMAEVMPQIQQEIIKAGQEAAKSI